MSLDPFHLILSLVIGLVATFVMDIWLEFRKRVFKIPSLNYCFLGRWILYMPEGVFTHRNIANVKEKVGECTIGRVAHYSIGAGFGALLVMMTSREWIYQPTILPALVWGVFTVFAPLFIMQPAFGFGVAASRAPSPGKARIQSLITHAIFGLGLYLAALVISLLLPHIVTT